MQLYGLITDRISINVLKLLYNNELKASYVSKLSNIQKILVLVEKPIKSLILLSKLELITTDPVENDVVLSITSKGKEFIETFDMLKEIIEEDKSNLFKDAIKISYELNSHEKRVIAMAYNISIGIEKNKMPVKDLVKELFPKKEYKRKINSVVRHIKKLQELSLMELSVEGKGKNKKTFVEITEKGIKTVKKQYLKGIVG